MRILLYFLLILLVGCSSGQNKKTHERVDLDSVPVYTNPLLSRGGDPWAVFHNKSVEPANKESEKTNQNSPLQAAIYEIIIFPAIWLILAIYWQIINLYFIDFSSFLWHNFNIYRHEFQNSILFHDYVLLFSNLICSNKYGQKTDKY